MTSTDPARAQSSRKRTRIQAENEEKILDAALEVFSSYGFRGATIDQIAEKVGMSKPNLLYYFRRKHDLYTAVLTRTLTMWLAPLGQLDPNGDPETEISTYVRQKLVQSRERPQESRLFISEILQGASHLGDILKTDLREIVRRKADVIQGWIDAGKLAVVDPVHLIFMIWAMTQHYADFDTQVRAVLGKGIDNAGVFKDANATVLGVMMKGILPR